MITSDKPNIQEFQLESVKHILPEDAWEALNTDRAILIDVRENYETLSYIENAQFHPMGQISNWLSVIPVNKPVIFVCKLSIRSTHVTHILTEQGYTNVVNLDGGFEAWKASGLPYKTQHQT